MKKGAVSLLLIYLVYGNGVSTGRQQSTAAPVLRKNRIFRRQPFHSAMQGERLTFPEFSSHMSLSLILTWFRRETAVVTGIIMSSCKLPELKKYRVLHPGIFHFSFLSPLPPRCGSSSPGHKDFGVPPKRGGDRPRVTEDILQGRGIQQSDEHVDDCHFP